MVILSLYFQGSVTAEKNADDLEEALMMKLLEKRAKKRGGDDDERLLRLDKTDFKYLKSDDKNDISIAIINDIKSIIKEPCLNLLASSELISWAELKERVDRAKKSLEMFEVKYRAELASGGATTLPVVGQARLAMTGMPGAVPVIPAPTPQAAIPIFGVKPAGMPGATPVSLFGMMPGVKPAVIATKPAVKQVDADEDEDEEDDVPVKPVGMPGLKPAGMPGAALVFGGMPMPAAAQPVKPVGMPGVAQPMGMPGLAQAPAFGGMPGLR